LANLLIWHQGKTIGPYTPQETDSYIASGHVSDQAPAWTEGLLDWSTVAEVLSTLRMRSISSTPPAFTDIATRVLIPDGVRKFSWAAFAAAPVWAISNQVWVGLLTFIPGVGQLLQLWFGFHGRELAWRKGRWANVAEFNQVQKKRATTSLLIWIPIVLCFAGWLIASGKLKARPPGQPQQTQETKKKLSLPMSRQEFERVFKGHTMGEIRTVLGAPAYDQTDKNSGVTVYGYKGVTLQPGSQNTDDGTLLIFSGGQLKEFKYVQEKKQ
jgi:hypothetical protein